MEMHALAEVGVHRTAYTNSIGIDWLLLVADDAPHVTPLANTICTDISSCVMHPAQDYSRCAEHMAHSGLGNIGCMSDAICSLWSATHATSRKDYAHILVVDAGSCCEPMLTYMLAEDGS